jgi:hypothetical protein
MLWGLLDEGLERSTGESVTLLGDSSRERPRHAEPSPVGTMRATSARGMTAGAADLRAVMAHQAARMASGRMMRPLGAVFLCLSLVLPPCTSPGLERTPHAGLGVSRAVLQAVFARPESAFICGAPHESRGVPSPGGNGTDAMVKVWGEASEAAGGESQPIALWAWSALVEVWRQGAEAPGSAGRLPLWGRRPWRGRGWGSARWRRRGRAWHLMAFRIHTLGIRHVVAPLQGCS